MVRAVATTNKKRRFSLENWIFASANDFRRKQEPVNELSEYNKFLNSLNGRRNTRTISPKFNLSKGVSKRGKYPSSLPLIEFTDASLGLVPIGDSGWYKAPQEPVDPQDCEAYPSSPFCGSIPFSFPPIDLGLKIVIDECNIGIQFKPVLAFIKLLYVEFVYRKTTCRTPKKEPEKPADFFCVPFDLIQLEDVRSGPPCDISVYRTKQISILSGTLTGKDNQGVFESCYISVAATFELLSYEIADFKFDRDRLKVKSKLTLNIEINSNYQALLDTYGLSFVTGTFTKDRTDFWFFMDRQSTGQYLHDDYFRHDKYFPAQYSPIDRGAFLFHYPIYPGQIPTFERYQDETKFACAYYKGESVIEGTVTGRDSDTIKRHALGYYNYTRIGESEEKQISNCVFKDIPPLPKLEEKKEKDEMAGCCNLVASIAKKVDTLNTRIIALTNKVDALEEGESSSEESDLAEKIDKLSKAVGEYEDEAKSLVKTVDKLSDIIGVDEYPASLPASLISEDEGWLGKLIPNDNVSIPNLTRLFSWYIERFDEIMGQFEIPIEIKDSDPTIPGDQPKGLKLPNIAESIAEIVTLLIQCSVNSETLISIATRTLIEAGEDKQQNFINHMLLDALTDYIGFNYKEKKVKLPMMFDPGKENLDEFLQETEIDVNVPEYNEKFNLQADFIRYRKAASILDSVFFKKVDPKGDIKKQILDDLKSTYKLAEQINKANNTEFTKFVDDLSDLYDETSTET